MNHSPHPASRRWPSFVAPCTVVVLAATGLTGLTGVAAVAAADLPSNCSAASNMDGGQDITCTDGVPKGETVTGTAEKDKIVILGTVFGTVRDGGGDGDVITVTGKNGPQGASLPPLPGGDGGAGVALDGTVESTAAHATVTIDGGSGGDGGSAGGDTPGADAGTGAAGWPPAAACSPAVPEPPSPSKAVRAPSGAMEAAVPEAMGAGR